LARVAVSRPRRDIVKVMMTERNIEYIPLSELIDKLHPQNPKQHNIGAIIESYKTHGYVASGVIDDRTGLFLAGHGRVKALSMMQKQGIAPPRGIIAANGDWRVPVQVGYKSDNDMQAKAYLAADNRLTELGGWDEPALAELLQELANSDEIDISASGYDSDDLDQLLRDLGMAEEPTPDPGAQVDRAAELNEKWQVQRGDVWEIGKHRIMCGDSTCAEDVDRLMGGVIAQMMVTDPPYGVDFINGKYLPDTKSRQRTAQWKSIENDDIQGDDLTKWLCGVWCVWLEHVKDDFAFYCWSAAKTEYAASLAAAAAAGIHIQSQIIWIKNFLVLGQADYQWRHENCLYGFIKGKHHRWLGGRKQTTIWEVDRVPTNNYEHPTQKPVELFTKPIENHTYDDEVICDPFLGSGTTIVACEQSGRVGYGMEIAPDYVAVCLERLAGMGLHPQRSE
jgi:DNA modification methylase